MGDCAGEVSTFLSLLKKVSTKTEVKVSVTLIVVERFK